MSLIRARQRVVTALFPHNANRRFIIPNRQISEPGPGPGPSDELLTNATFDANIDGWESTSAGVAPASWAAGGLLRSTCNSNTSTMQFRTIAANAVALEPGDHILRIECVTQQATTPNITGFILDNVTQDILHTIPTTPAPGIIETTFNIAAPIMIDVQIRATGNFTVGEVAEYTSVSLKRVAPL